jgi:hypothetical protein
VHWICGDATALQPQQVDLATMTANVAQAIVDPQTWQRTLRGTYEALRPGGYLVFETRDPARRAWEGWNRETSYRETEVPGIGAVETWVEPIDVGWPLVTFRWTYVFSADGQVLTSDSTLRFREAGGRDRPGRTRLCRGVRSRCARSTRQRVRLLRATSVNNWSRTT